MILRVVSGIMFLVFALCMIVQLNDPDGSLWMVIYAFPALLSAMAAFKKHTAASVLGALAYPIAFAILMPWDHIDQLGSYVSEVHMSSQASEYSREAIGLLIAGAWMAVLAVVWYRNRKTTTPQSTNATE